MATIQRSVPFVVKRNRFSDFMKDGNKKDREVSTAMASRFINNIEKNKRSR